MLFAGNGGASTLADYGDPFQLEIQPSIGNDDDFYPGETIVVKLTDFALQEGHTVKSVTVWTLSLIHIYMAMENKCGNW